MSAPTRGGPTDLRDTGTLHPDGPAGPDSRGGLRGVPAAAGVAAGAAVLLAAGPVSAVVEGATWFAYAAAAVVVVVLAGLLAHRLGPLGAVFAQLAALTLLVTALFSTEGVAGLLPGPAALTELAFSLGTAREEIDVGVPPIAGTPSILLLVTIAFGLLTTAVHLAAVAARSPAAAGIPLLAVFAVPAALADDPLPWWALAGAALGFGVLLAAGAPRRRGGDRPSGVGAAGSGVVLVAVALAAALGLGSLGPLGTEGRFADAGAGPGGSSIGLAPFTALRGQLERDESAELFEITGLPRPTYLRALTLSQYRPDVGWEAVRPAPGVPLTGDLPGTPTPGDTVDVAVENVGFRDYWLPFFGEPLQVTGVDRGDWTYDPASGTGYAVQPRSEDGWTQTALLPRPSADQLRAADPSSGAATAGVDPTYLDLAGVDDRVLTLAAEITAEAGTGFDRAVALQQHFAGPGSAFTYALETAPGTGDDALVEFLTEGRTGYCEQYASAMAVMLRAVGVPSRVAVGFTAGSVSGADTRTISTSDAHAWVEAWFPGVGWTLFDPTPLTDGRRVEPSYVQETEASPESGDVADDVAVPSATPAPAPVDGGQDPDADLAAPLPETAAGDTDGARWPWWTAGAALLVGAVVALPAVLRAGQRRRRRATTAQGGPDAAGAGWTELVAASADRGVVTPPSDTVRGAARRIVREHGLDAPSRDALRTVITAVEASWYGGVHARAGELDAPVEQVRTAIAAGSPLPLRRRLLPASLWAGRTPPSG